MVHLTSAPPDAAALLSRLRRLRELRCPLLAEMAALLQCPALTALHLDVDVDEAAQAHVSGAEALLRAGRLERLTLQYPEDEERAAAVNLVRSLAGSGAAAPALRHLSFHYVGGYVRRPQGQLQPLAAALGRLVHLVSLDLGGPLPEGYLEVFDGTAVPNLEALSYDANVPDDCPHERAHGEAVRAVLRRYPRLHMVVDTVHAPAECSFCVDRQCHNFPENELFVLYSHPSAARCALKHVGLDIQLSVD